MNKKLITGNIAQFKDRIKQKWGELTEQDFDQVKNEKDKLIDLIQKKYNAEKEVIIKDLDEIMGVSNEVWDETKDLLLQKKDEALDYTHNLSSEIQQKIKNNPLPSVMIGACIGFIIGKICK